MKWDPEDYARSSSEQARWAKEFLEHLHLRGDEHILDVGCGDGKISAEIARRVPQGSVLGIDQSAEMVRFAREAHPKSRHARLDFAQGEATRLDFDARFDRIVSFSCLHWIQDHPAVLRGFHRALRPGGRIHLQFGGKGNALPIREVTEEVIRMPQWAPYFRDFVEPWRFCSVEEYREWLREAGLVEVRVELVPKDMTHQGEEGLAAWLRTTHGVPYFARLPELLHEDFIREDARAYVSKYPVDAQGRTHVPMVRLEVEAIRARVGRGKAARGG